jgi:8-oxo-dGTP diphosphatase
MDAWNNKKVFVAVGIVMNPAGEILIAKRQAHQDHGECWEFPGGKIEPDETVELAIQRELLEEVGIEVHQSEPWLEIHHDYPHKSVCLKVQKITAYSGMALGKEGQAVDWVKPEALSQYVWPEANQEIVQALQD